MTVIHSKYLQLWPVLWRHPWCFVSWLDHIKNNRDSILICLADCAHVGICSESFHRAESFRADLTCLEEWQHVLWLILLKQFGDSLLHLLRGHLCLSALLRDVTLGLLWQHRGLHDDCEGSPLPQLLFETRG